MLDYYWKAQAENDELDYETIVIILLPGKHYKILIFKEVFNMTSLLSLIPRNRTFLPTHGLFDRLFEDWDMPSLFNVNAEWVPAFDISENEKEYIITAELPGIDIKDVDITLSEGILSVKGEKKQEKEDKGEDYHMIERHYGSFHRSFSLPGKVEADKIDANYKDGLLKLTLPKAEASKTKKIEVK
jgi:HSP20 family protein